MKLLNLFAYLDPGTGSIIVQSIIGFIAGIGLFGRRFFMGIAAKLRNIFGGSTKKD